MLHEISSFLKLQYQIDNAWWACLKNRQKQRRRCAERAPKKSADSIVRGPSSSGYIRVVIDTHLFVKMLSRAFLRPTYTAFQVTHMDWWPTATIVWLQFFQTGRTIHETVGYHLRPRADEYAWFDKRDIPIGRRQQSFSSRNHRGSSTVKRRTASDEWNKCSQAMVQISPNIHDLHQWDFTNSSISGLNDYMISPEAPASLGVFKHFT